MIRDANLEIEASKAAGAAQIKTGNCAGGKKDTQQRFHETASSAGRIGSLQCLSLRCLASEEVRTRMLFEGIRADAT